MKIAVLRQKTTDDGTPGIITVLDTGWARKSLELPWRNNRRGESCIITDSYSCDIWYSEHLGRNVLRLEDKHGRQDCLVHNATWAGDVGKGDITQVHGCTAVGDAFAQVQRPDGKMQFGILNSKATLDALLKEIGPGPHTITYEWVDSCAPDDLSDALTVSQQ